MLADAVVLNVADLVVAAISRDRGSVGPLANHALNKTLPKRPSVKTDGRFCCAFLKRQRTRCQGQRRLVEKSQEIGQRHGALPPSSYAPPRTRVTLKPLHRRL